MEDQRVKYIESKIRSIQDYPKPGINFRDITPMLHDRKAFAECIGLLKERANGTKANYIVGIDARGFIIGSALAYALDLGFVPARKKGKLPYDTVSMGYDMEYGSSSMEIHSDALKKGDIVIVVDDLLATGGTAGTVGKLVEKLGARIESYLFVIELVDLKGREKLDGGRVASLVSYRGE